MGPNRFLVMMMIVCCLASCRGMSGPDPLAGTSWALISSENRLTLNGRPITLRFEHGGVQGSSGCNSFGGDYRLSGKRIVIENLFSTMMACPEPEGIMEQEQHYLYLLGEVDSYSIVGGNLQLFASRSELLTFKLVELREQ